MTDNAPVGSGAVNSLTLDQQFTIIRDSFDAVCEQDDSRFTKLSQGRYRYRNIVVAFSYVYGEATITLTPFGRTNVLDQYVGRNPLRWFLIGPDTPDSLYLEMHTRLHNHAV